jgi:hypothetical protein
MLIEIAGDTMRFEAVTRTGAVIDRGRIEQPRRLAPLEERSSRRQSP